MKKIKNKFIGYTAFNTKTEYFLDYDGNEDPKCFECWKKKKHAEDVLSEIDWIIKNANNKHSKYLKKNRKYFKIVIMHNKINIIE